MATANDGQPEPKKRNRGRNRGTKRTLNEVERMERQRQALDMRLASKSFREIGAELGISTSTAHKLVEDALEALAPVEEAEELRQVSLEQLKRLVGHWLPHAFGQDRINVLVKSTDRETGIQTVETQAVMPTFASQRDATETLGKLLDRVHKFAGLDQLDQSQARQDPAEMGLSGVDQELMELVEALKANDPERVQ